MKFRLYYEGSLFSSQGSAPAGQIDRRRAHKGAIRRQIHSQLVELWRQNRSLSEARSNGEIFGLPAGNHLPLQDQLMRVTPKVCGRAFVPLVHPQFEVFCRLDILLLRRDEPGGIFTNGRDLDNRIKTLIDGLQRPQHDGEVDNLPDDAPTFVLLENDRLINAFSVETDTLLATPETAANDDSYVRALISVEIVPKNFNNFNAIFA